VALSSANGAASYQPGATPQGAGSEKQKGLKARFIGGALAGKNETGLQPLRCNSRVSWGVAPGWYEAAPLALKAALWFEEVPLALKAALWFEEVPLALKAALWFEEAPLALKAAL